MSTTAVCVMKKIVFSQWNDYQVEFFFFFPRKQKQFLGMEANFSTPKTCGFFCFCLCVAAALLGQEIFVAGGQAEQEVINSAEVYNPELNQWEHMVARMLTPRVGLALVSMGNLIYAIGMCATEISSRFPCKELSSHKTRLSCIYIVYLCFI